MQAQSRIAGRTPLPATGWDETAMVRRALVLGGGGPVGIAWESGLIAGLERGGVRLADADRIVGTSAGSVVGAQLALGASGADLAATQRQQFARDPKADVHRAASDDATKARAPAPDLSALMALFARRPAGTGATGPDGEAEAQQQRAWRQEVGQFALAARTIAPEAFIASFGRIAGSAWPQRDYRCTAIDATTGAFRVWTAADAVPLGAAIASSCAVPGIYPCIPIAGARWYDGGLRSATNADVALGTGIGAGTGSGTGAPGDTHPDVVVVISVMPASALAPAGAANPLEAELATLRAAGAAVTLIVADAQSREAFGPNLMDARRRPGALAAGEAQGEALAAQLRASW